jgi:hypothetical protein
MANEASSIIGLVPTIFAIGAVTVITREFTTSGKRETFELDSTRKTKAAAQRRVKQIKQDIPSAKTRIVKKGRRFQVFKHEPQGFFLF